MQCWVQCIASQPASQSGKAYQQLRNKNVNSRRQKKEGEQRRQLKKKKAEEEGERKVKQIGRCAAAVVKKAHMKN